MPKSECIVIKNHIVNHENIFGAVQGNYGLFLQISCLICFNNISALGNYIDITNYAHCLCLLLKMKFM